MPSRGQLARTNHETTSARPADIISGSGSGERSVGNTQPVRLYVKGCFYSYLRGQRNSYQHTALLKLQGVQDKKAAEFYFGKRVAYIYKVSAPSLVSSCLYAYPTSARWLRLRTSHLGSMGCPNLSSLPCA